MKVIVPCDFTKVVPSAMSYAVRMSPAEGVEVDLLHIYEGGGNSKLSLDQARAHLEEAGREYSKTYGVKVEAVLREGSLGTSIRAVAEERHASYIVMGTHGISGMQRFFGSKAIKVVNESEIPFLIVQTPAEQEIFKRLIMPVGARPEDVEKFNWCLRLVKEYGSELHAVLCSFSDSGLQRKASANMALLERLCSNSGIRCTTHTAQKGKTVPAELERVARENKCDWMLIMITQAVSGIAATFNSTDQELISNGLEIPVMCVNPSMSERW